MLISRKRQVTHLTSCLTTRLSLRGLSVSNTWGLLSPQICHGRHVESICTKSQELLGLLYHRFYKHAEPSALELQLVSFQTIVAIRKVWHARLNYNFIIPGPSKTPPRVCERCLGSSPTKRHTAH